MHVPYRSTADPEAFQSHVFKCASKRYAFSPPVYNARVLLAALDYNFHLQRPFMRSKDGKKMLYKRDARRWSVCALKTPKTYGYIRELQTKIVAKRLSSGKGMPARRSQRPDDPRRLGPLPPIPPPPAAELAKTQLRRGDDAVWQQELPPVDSSPSSSLVTENVNMKKTNKKLRKRVVLKLNCLENSEFVICFKWRLLSLTLKMKGKKVQKLWLL